jgi:hypothetical protein
MGSKAHNEHIFSDLLPLADIRPSAGKDHPQLLALRSSLADGRYSIVA